MPSSLSLEARKVLNRWAKDDLYVYLRPVSSKYIDTSQKETIYWCVNVEFRRVEEPKQFRGEGYDLDAVILDLAERVPRRRQKLSHAGWLSPEGMEAQVAVKAQQKGKKKKPKKNGSVVHLAEHVAKKKKK